jgi:Spy/CpxP family protein refolding chaperone
MMKKTLITTALALSAVSFAFAQDAGTTTPPALPPAVTTGDVRIDAQIKALRIEMETKIKAIRDEYQVKLRALVGTRRTQMASTTNTLRKEVKEVRKEIKEERKEYMEDRREQRVEGASSTASTTSPREMNQRFMNFFRSFLGR